MDGSQDVEYIMQDWNDGRDEFCRQETLIIRRPELNVNVCALAGTEVEFTVKINDATAENSIDFSGANAMTSFPDPAPVTFTQWPESLTFKFTGHNCASSSNKQRRKVRARRGLRALNHRSVSKKGKGQSASAPTSAPNKTADDVGDSGGGAPAGAQFDCVETSTDIPYGAFVTASSGNHLTSSLLFCGYLQEEDNFKIERVPQDIVITVYDGPSGGNVIQTVTFATSCSMDLTIRDSFGSVTVAGFVSADGTAFPG